LELADKKILLTGGAGFLGRYVMRELKENGAREKDIRIPSIEDCDLRDWENCVRAVEGMDIVIHLAARVGGIGYNRRNPAVLFYDNFVMGAHLMEAARKEGIEKFVQVGTVCAYPKFTPVPFREETLWDGYPEETNAPYGIAKKSLLVMAQAMREQYGFNAIYLLPVNLYGPGDNFDPEDSHVIPALIRKCVEAAESGLSEIVVWGTGKPTREFLHVRDCARGIVTATMLFDGAEPVNLGSGEEISIHDLVLVIAELTGYEGGVRWDASRPDGQPRRCLDTSRAKEFGFEATIQLREGITETIEWYRGTRGKRS
jgi:GDP-L-fucose synthase